MSRSQAPDVLPVLSPGRHRRVEEGACFMEWASLLAGERWSDRPACTHPLLAHLARMVNDATGETARSRLVRLIPSVIGLVSDDPRWAYAIASQVACRVLPVAEAEDQEVLAAGILTSERMLALAERRPADEVRADARVALSCAPAATAWAREFTHGLVSLRSTHHPGESIVEYAVQSVLRADPACADELLVEVLTEAVALCEVLAGRRAGVPVGAQPAATAT
jgi:hypothetical protein